MLVTFGWQREAPTGSTANNALLRRTCLITAFVLIKNLLCLSCPRDAFILRCPSHSRYKSPHASSHVPATYPALVPGPHMSAYCKRPLSHSQHNTPFQVNWYIFSSQNTLQFFIKGFPLTKKNEWKINAKMRDAGMQKRAFRLILVSK